jgi:16S rRNA A1518/A1519 N6-dimethyltransferase RsmA/KsgA/DIM1 with predicted DNA glycosylase/AP lyase activity
MQAYKVILIRDNRDQLKLDIDSKYKIIPNIPPYISQTLVGILTNPSNDNSSIYSLF